MKRPYIVCHMIMSIDGKTTGEFMWWEEKYPISAAYAAKIQEYAPKAYIGGRKSIQAFTQNRPMDLSKYEGIAVERTDFIADATKDYYVVTIDPSGKINWDSNILPAEFGVFGNAYGISILSNKVSDAYLAFLQDVGISYLICGDEEIDLNLAMEKLYQYFGFEKVLLEGGPTINGYFAKAGLVDELSVVVAPTTGYSKPNSSLFYTEEEVLDSSDMVFYTFEKMEQLEKSVLWLNYKKA